MKKFRCLTFFLAFAFVCANAHAISDLRFVIEDAKRHPDVLSNVLPIYLNAGVSWTGLSLMEDNTTDLRFLVGLGWQQRKMWQNIRTGDIINAGIGEKPLVYNVFITSWTLRFSQGFFNSRVADRDYLTLSAGYTGRYENAFGKGKVLCWDLGSNMDSVFEDEYHGSVYPDLNGNRKLVTNRLDLSLYLDEMKIMRQLRDGWSASLEFTVGPGFLTALGKADFYSLYMSAKWARVLYNKTGGKGDSVLSVSLRDAMVGQYVFGSAIPAFVERSSALSYKVRGYDGFSYNTTFSVANNLDVSLTGPVIDPYGLFLRLKVFADVGYAGDRLVNTDIRESKFLFSTGVSFEIGIVAGVYASYQLAYLILGESFESEGGKFTRGFFFSFE